MTQAQQVPASSASNPWDSPSTAQLVYTGTDLGKGVLDSKAEDLHLLFSAFFDSVGCISVLLVTTLKA